MNHLSLSLSAKTAEDFDLRVKNDGGEVDGISGATISSRAFCEAVKTGA